MVQYRGDILPLIRVDSLLTERRRRPRSVPPSFETERPIQTIVFTRDGGPVGLVVEQILDTVEESLANVHPASRSGVVGSAVIHGRVTEILDLDVMDVGLVPELSSARGIVATTV